jgi:uncharacterized membrane protein (DUF485 family)
VSERRSFIVLTLSCVALSILVVSVIRWAPKVVAMPVSGYAVVFAALIGFAIGKRS